MANSLLAIAVLWSPRSSFHGLRVVNPFFFSSPSCQQETTGYLSGPSDFLIRAASSKDLMSLAEILTESFHSHSGLMELVYPILRLGIYEDLRNRLRLASDRYICLVAERAIGDDSRGTHLSGLPDSLVGTVEMTLRANYPWEAPSSQFLYLSNLAVHPDYRRQGIAQELLLKCEGTAIEWGFSDIYLHVLENNHAARRLYYKTGYRLQHVDWNWTCWLLGQPRRLFLRKQLPIKAKS